MAEIAQTPEAVALELLNLVAKVEGKALSRSNGPAAGYAENVADRKWIISTYAECLAAVTTRSSERQG